MQYVLSSFVSCNTACRCANVPRAESCPVRRIGIPSCKIEAYVNASPAPQSALFPSSNTFSLRFKIFSSFLNTLKPSGRLSIPRSEEHTSELQSRGHLVCRLLLEKK